MGMTGVVVNFATNVADKEGFAEFAKNIALQTAAMPVQYLNREAVPASVLDEEKAIVMTQLQNDPKNSNKPAQILEKMVIGKVGKYYEANCLLEQAYVKDDKLTVGKYVEACAKEFGGKIKVVSFTLFEKGEGLQKREENFAEEIAKLAGGNK
jgi:elongation factor Ts